MIALLIAATVLLSSLIPPALTEVDAEDNVEVTIGQDAVFTSYNLHETSTAVAPNHPGKESPSVMDANSTGQEAATHVLSGINQEGNAKGSVGVRFLVQPSVTGVAEATADISITISYSLTVDFNVGTAGGSVDAIVYSRMPGYDEMVDRINYLHYPNTSHSDGTVTVTHQVPLSAGGIYDVYAHTYSYADIYSAGYGDSQCTASVEEIGIHFNMTAVEGYVYYDNSSNHKPVRYAKVKFWDNNTVNGVTFLGENTTDSSGYYRSPEFCTTGADGQPRNVYLDVYAETASCVVKNYDAAPKVYHWVTDPSVSVSTGLFTLASAYTPDSVRPAFFIMDTVIDGYDFLSTRVGWSRSQVTAHWPDTDPTRAYTDPLTGGDFYIGADHQFSRYSTLHEYAHCVHWATRGGFPSPSVGGHNRDSETNGGFALTEGWAEFMGGAVDNTPSDPGVWVGSLETTVYADGVDANDWDGNVVEGAVANIFWDIFDGTSPSDYPSWDSNVYGDFVDGQFSKLWTILLNDRPDDIDSFWSSWTPKDPNIWAVFYHARIDKDTIPPSNPTSYGSSHTINAWSNDGTIDINWLGSSDDLSGIAGYSFVWDNSPSTIPDDIIDTTNSSTTSAPSGDGDWYFHVRTSDRSGHWADGAHHVGPFRIDAATPSVPTLVSPTSWKKINNSATLDWSDVTDPSGVTYRIRLYNSSWSLLEEKPGLTSSAYAVSSFGSLADGTYYWRVRAVDGAGNASAWTTSWAFKLDNMLPSMPVHQSPTSWKQVNNSATLDWSDVSDASGVTYQVRLYSRSWSLVKDKTGLTSSAYAVSSFGSLADGTYYWRVRAMDGAGNASAWTTSWAFKLDNTLPSVPVHLSPPSWKKINSSATLDWSDVSDASGVTYQIRLYNSSWSMVKEKTGLTSSAYAVSSLGSLADGTYYWRVRAVDGAGNASAWTTSWAFKLDSTVP
jgi:Tfp pilus assembly protein PilX